MIEVRPLKEKEIMELIESAPKTEKHFIERINDPVKFLNSQKEQIGIVSNDRPIYLWVISLNRYGHHHLWTIVNKDVKEQFSLFKICYRNLDRVNKQYGDIYALMYKDMPKNIAWTERLGFKRVRENNNMILFKRRK